MWHKAPCSSRDYSGVRESGPRKIDDDGDVDEDDHRGDDSPPDGTPAEGGGSPPCAFSYMAFPWMGRGSPLVLGLHGDDGPSEILPHGLR